MLRQLTADEYLGVELATRGESYTHRRWPHEVVRALVAADVVKAGEGRLAAKPVKALCRRIRARLAGRRGGAAGFAA